MFKIRQRLLRKLITSITCVPGKSCWMTRNSLEIGRMSDRNCCNSIKLRQ